ncbi:MAG: hypothetical protein QM648_08085 [Solirubrobacterales bacterium]
MGKRSRNRQDEQLDASTEEQLATAEKEYRSLKRTMGLGLFVVGLLIIGLIIQQPGGWLPAVVILALIEGVSYFFLRRSLERRRVERLDRIRSGEVA